MSNSYTKAAFGLTVTSAEADLMRRVIGATELIGNRDVDLNELETHYAALGPDFAARFPRTADSPFDGLLDLFLDLNYPTLDCAIELGDADEMGQVVLFFSGEQFGVEPVANLIQRCARSALPFGFEWASDCDRLRAGEFGGCCVVITEAKITYAHTSQLLERGIGRARDEGTDGFVLALRDPEHGLSFRTDTGGLDRLARARVFSEAEAASFDVTAVAGEPEWLAMPAPLRW